MMTPNSNNYRAEKKRTAPNPLSNIDLNAAAFATTITPDTGKRLKTTTKKTTTTVTHSKNNSNNHIDLINFDSFTEETTKSIEASRVQKNRPRFSDANRKTWQLRCIHNDNNNASSPAKLRVLLVHGATPLFALNRYIAKSFGMLWHKPFDHRLTKGHNPPSSFFVWKDDSDNTKRALVSGTKTAISKVMKENKNPPFLSDRKVYVEDVFIQRGDSLDYCIYHYDDQSWSVKIICDGITKPNNKDKQPYFPMLVGADKSLNKLSWFDINIDFNGGRGENEWCLVSNSLTPTQQRDAVANMQRIPLFDNTGHEYTYEETCVGFDGLKVLHEQVRSGFIPVPSDVKSQQSIISPSKNNVEEEEDDNDYRMEDDKISNFFNKLSIRRGSEELRKFIDSGIVELTDEEYDNMIAYPFPKITLYSGCGGFMDIVSNDIDGPTSITFKASNGKAFTNRELGEALAEVEYSYEGDHCIFFEGLHLADKPHTFESMWGS